MNSNDKHSLWLDSTRSHYFLIPNDQELPFGKLTILNLAGDTKHVDSTVIAAFEITKTQAAQYIQAEFNQAWRQTKDALSTFTDLTATAQGKTNTDFQATSNPIASLLGISSEELHNNPDALKQGLHHLFNGFQDLLKAATSEDTTDIETARHKMRSLRQNLTAKGVNLSEDIEQLPDTLRKQYLNAETEPSLKDSAVKLKESTVKVQTSFMAMLQTIKEGAEKLQTVVEEAKSENLKERSKSNDDR